ncbi:MAG: hypothetical protein AB8B93_14765 [Pseudomonadales bacterium]
MLVIAAGLLTATALIHSALGERLIFSRLARIAPALTSRQRGILRASWHVVSVCGLAFALQLLLLAGSVLGAQYWIALTIAAALLGSALLVLVCTRARHPGWVALALAGLLAFFGQGWG